MFTTPRNQQELYALQTDTTKLLRTHESGLVARKLERKGKNPSDYATEKDRRDAAGKISDSTLKSYERRAASLLRDAELHGIDVWVMSVERATTKNSWYFCRAALQHVVAERLRTAKREVDAFDRLATGSSITKLQRDEAGDAMFRIAHNANVLAAMPSLEYGKWAPAVGSSKVKGSSKRKSLRGLPTDWQVMIAKSMPAACALSWLTQSLTGCRAAELEKGVSLTLSTDGSMIRAKVLGAKITEHAGQPYRELVMGTQSGVAAALVPLLKRGVELDVGLGRRLDAYRKMVGRYGDAMFPGRSGWTSISPYSARNQMKSDLKAAGVSPEKLAEAMGHSSTGSAKNYGGSKRTGAVAPLGIRASRPVKTRLGYTPKTSASPSPNIPAVPARPKRPRNGP